MHTEEPQLQIKKVVEEIVANPEKYPDEAKFILVLEVWGRRGGLTIVDTAYYEVIEGEAKEIVLEQKDPGYPYPIYEKVALIPLKLPTVIHWKKRYDTGDYQEKEDVIYVFTRDGWKRVDI